MGNAYFEERHGLVGVSGPSGGVGAMSSPPFTLTIPTFLTWLEPNR